MLIRLPSACHGRTAVQFPANSSHMCCVELALKGVLCTCLGRKGPLNTWALIRVNSFSWLPRPFWYGCAHALGTGRASFQFFFSISLKFRSRRKVFLDRLSRKRNEELLVYFNVFKTPVSKRVFRELCKIKTKNTTSRSRVTKHPLMWLLAFLAPATRKFLCCRGTVIKLLRSRARETFSSMSTMICHHLQFCLFSVNCLKQL